MGFFSRKNKDVANKYDLMSEINIDFESLSFIGIEKPKKSSEFKVYREKLNVPQFGVFDQVEVFAFEDGSKNIFFTSDINNTDYDDLKSFVNKLVKNLGNDSYGRGVVDENEIDEIVISNFWLGRTWDKISPNVSIHGIDQENFKLSISGVN